MCHKETKALISLRTRDQSALNTLRGQRTHKNITLNTTQASPPRRCNFPVSHRRYGEHRQKEKEEEDEQTNRNILMLFLGVSFFSCHWWRAMFVFQSRWKKTLHIPELASTSEAPFILTEFQIIFIPFVAQIWCSQGWLRWKGNITTSDFSLLTVTSRSGVPQRWYENRVLM